jgi:hypothetical protein
MITGYNTDVRHREVVLHVQTEDKGLGNPFIESLVYVGGRVLVAKRMGYGDMLSEGSVGEKEIVALMDRQHRTMIAAIRHGKFDDKLAALRERFEPEGAGETAPVTDATVARMAEARNSATTAAPAGPAAGRGTAETTSATLDRTLDQVILEYLTNEAEQDQLVLLLEGSQDVGLGQRAHLDLKATSSRSGEPVADTEVTVKMISTADEPRMLAVGKVARDGRLGLEFDIPFQERGTSALIITGVCDLGRAELKQLL